MYALVCLFFFFTSDLTSVSTLIQHVLKPATLCSLVTLVAYRQLSLVATPVFRFVGKKRSSAAVGTHSTYRFQPKTNGTPGPSASGLCSRLLQ